MNDLLILRDTGKGLLPSYGIRSSDWLAETVEGYDIPAMR